MTKRFLLQRTRPDFSIKRARWNLMYSTLHKISSPGMVSILTVHIGPLSPTRSETNSRLISQSKNINICLKPILLTRLLFNLVFFAVDIDTAKSYSISIFYEKAQTPIIDITSVVPETIRN